MKPISLPSIALFVSMLFALTASGQTDSIPSPASGPFGANPISNDQFAILLSIDYNVRILSNGWLDVRGGTADFYAQSSPTIPELNFRKAWPNTVNLTPLEVNAINAGLSHGGLHLDQNTHELILEFSDPHLAEKPSAKGLLASVQMFEMMIEAVVDMIAQM
jgi:hypothetical protein